MKLIKVKDTITPHLKRLTETMRNKRPVLRAIARAAHNATLGPGIGRQGRKPASGSRPFPVSPAMNAVHGASERLGKQYAVRFPRGSKAPVPVRVANNPDIVQTTEHSITVRLPRTAQKTVVAAAAKEALDRTIQRGASAR